MVELIDLLMQGGQRGLGLGSLAEEDDAFHDILIIDDSAVLVPDCLAELPEPLLGSLHDGSEVGGFAPACRVLSTF